MKITWRHYSDWLQDLVAAELPCAQPAPHPNTFVTDSRALQQGQWFFALRGEQHDGHDYIAAARQRGASGFCADISYRAGMSAELASRGIWIEAGKQLSALQALARGYRRTLSSTKIVAITGSAGKTTTKELLRCALQQHLRVSASLANYNNEIGVAQTLLAIAPDTDIAIVECGARQRGDLALLAELTAPDIVLITNIGSAHVGIFGSPQALLQGKLELLQHSPLHCLGIVNADCQALLQAASKLERALMTFGKQRADVCVSQVSLAEQQHVQLSSKARGKFTLISNNLHSAMPINLAAVTAVCIALDIPTAALQAGSKQFSNVPSRFQKITRGELTVIDDSYNANPESMRCGLVSLQNGWPQQRPVLVLGDMVELGDAAVVAHRELGDVVLALKPALLITVGQLARHIAEAVPQLQSLSFNDVEAFLRAEINLTQYSNLVYLKASRKVDLTRIVATLT